MPLTVLPCDGGWADRLGAVHATAFTGADIWPQSAIADLLAGPCVSGLCAVQDDAVVGFVLLQIVADEAEILTIAVGPAWHRRGIGRALMRAALDRAVAAGVARMFLDVAAGNVGARALYAALGFVEIGTRRRYYPDGTDAHVLALMLNGSRPDL